MKKVFNKENIVLIVNCAIITALLTLNYFYQNNGFDYTLKCVCSVMFAVIGLINLGYAYFTKQENMKYFLIMAIGLIFAMAGDIAINKDFIIGAALFAVGHILFVVAYCFLKKLELLEWIIGLGIFIAGAAFLIFFPELNYDSNMIKWLCVVYAFVISIMLGKAIANYVKERNWFYLIIMIGSFLFFFSDLMLVLDNFLGTLSWTDNACMGTYYPALCLLAFSMCFKIRFKK